MHPSKRVNHQMKDTAHTLAKLVAHLRLSLTENTFKQINIWTNSMATLYWLLNRGTWSRYVRNRVKAIKDLGKFTWRYVPTDQNLSDLDTRGISIVKLNEFWFKGPNWLSNEMKWPKLLRITAFIKRFIHNCLKARHSGALTTEEIKLAETFWIKVAQIEIDEEINVF